MPILIRICKKEGNFMKKPVFRGSAVALITPYTKDGSAVDFEAYGVLIDRQIALGTAALVVCATTGEAPTLTDDEHHACIDFAVSRAKGRIPVIAGTGSNDTAHAVEMSRYAMRAGADAVLMVTPYYNKPTQAGLYAQYAHIAAHVDLPIILYNVPSRTSVCIGAETYEKLSKIENINGVKEASGDFALVNEIFFRCGDDLNVWAGNDDITVPVLAMGGAGVVSTAANVVPDVMAKMCSLYFAGEQLDKGAYVSVDIFGSGTSSAFDKMTGKICEVLEAELGIPSNHVYVEYRATPDWGYNGRNF